MTAIHKFGTEAHKERWLPGMAAGGLIGCFGLTEPEAGSDPASMTTAASQVGNRWVINGAKRWIGLASIADVAVIWARTTHRCGTPTTSRASAPTKAPTRCTS
jgi:glutaryl-CoA dehydrogenase